MVPNRYRKQPTSPYEDRDKLYECLCTVKDLNMPSLMIMGNMNGDNFNENSDITRRFCDRANVYQLSTNASAILLINRSYIN